MKSRRRPYVRTLIVGSALAITGCDTTQEHVTVNPAPPEEDVFISNNPPMDQPIDAADAGPSEDAQAPEPELPPMSENPAPEPEE